MADGDSVESTETVELEEEPLVKQTESPEAQTLSPRGVKFAICASHALSTWSERTWAFAVGLIFLEIYKDSLFFVSLFGLVQALASILFSPSVGMYIDRAPRLKAVCVFYFLQNMGLVLAALASLVLLSNKANPSGTTGTLSALAVVAFGIWSRAGTMGGTIAIEKDWTKALTGTNSQELAKLNSTLKMIDLICLIIAPIVSGVLMSYCSMTVAVVQILLYNLVAWFPEVALLKYAVSRAPQLRIKQKPTIDDMDDAAATLTKRIWMYCTSLKEGFRLYFQQASVLASLSLAVLHLTVLSFGILMTAYLKWLGLSEAKLSLYRGAAALTGVMGAKAFPYLHGRYGLRISGFLSNAFFLTCILLGALPDIGNLIFPISSSIRFNFLVGAIAVSRFGLWVFDLSVSQIIQEWVDETQLGRVSAFQQLLENAFTVVIFIGGLIAPHPQDFVWLMLSSVIAVSISFILFLLFLTKSRFKALTRPQELEMTNDPL